MPHKIFLQLVNALNVYIVGRCPTPQCNIPSDFLLERIIVYTLYEYSSLCRFRDSYALQIQFRKVHFTNSSKGSPGSSKWFELYNKENILSIIVSAERKSNITIITILICNSYIKMRGHHYLPASVQQRRSGAK